MHEELLLRRLDSCLDKQELLRRWTRILNDAGRAHEVRRFLECHPHFLPGLHEHHPRCGVVITSHPFGNDFIADFFFVAQNPTALHLTLVRLEQPSDRIFHRDLSFTRGFTRVLHRMHCWKLWSREHKKGLVDWCTEVFQQRTPQHEDFSADFFLVYGRSSEVETSPLSREIWSNVQLLSKDIKVMTYDDLTVNVEAIAAEKIYNSIAVCAYKQGGLFLKGDIITDHH